MLVLPDRVANVTKEPDAGLIGRLPGRVFIDEPGKPIEVAAFGHAHGRGPMPRKEAYRSLRTVPSRHRTRATAGSPMS